jgi:hypothetical protein
LQHEPDTTDLFRQNAFLTIHGVGAWIVQRSELGKRH